VTASRGAEIVARVRTDSTGEYRLALSDTGAYTVAVRRLGYTPTERAIRRGPDTGELGSPCRPARNEPAGEELPSVALDVSLPSVASRLETVTVTRGAPVAIDTRTGEQVFQQNDYHGTPTATTSQIIQQSVAGAARAPTGEVHIHGQHAEYTYYIDGVPVPQSIGGTLNELFDPAIVDRIGFQTGGWDAEFGNKNIAVVNVQTRIPTGGLHAQASAYVGSFNTDGQSLLASTNEGPWGFLVSGTRSETDMRREPVMASPQGIPLNVHNAGQDQYGFAKVEYTPSSRDIVTLDLDASRTHAGIPFDSIFGVINDYQTDVNGFLNLAIRHRLADGRATRGPSEVFAAVYLRRSTLDYVPGPNDHPPFAFYPDTTDRFNVQEHRAATTIGVKADYVVSPVRFVNFKTGIDASVVEGREDFNTVDSAQRAGPSVNSGVRGGDFGLYAQSVLDPSPHWQLRAGVRLDHDVAPIAGDIHAVSPRVRLNWLPDQRTTVWAYYGRLFIPSNVEDFHVLAAAGNGGTVGQPTVPERDNYYETGIAHRFSDGVTAKVDGFFRDDGPAIDDNVLPGTALDATVNVAKVHVTGLEMAIDVHPAGPLSGYLNAALSHASAHGPVTGGFFPTPYPTGWFDQDHDQRLSVVGNAVYSWRFGYVGVTGTFGSGLTNGDPAAAPNHTGLFDFNPSIKVPPSFIVDPSVGTFFTAGATVIRCELFADNVFNRRYVLKGAFTSGPSIGRPRSLQLQVTVIR